MNDENRPLLAEGINDDEINIINKPLFVTKASSNRLTISYADVTEEKEVDFVSAVFVATFDTNRGNIIEWSQPPNLQLDFLEFKALPSGAHTVGSDFIYFRCGDLFGLGCYARKRVDCQMERGARMKTVAILAPNYTTLYRHMSFLENQVHLHLQNLGSYEGLVEFLKDHQPSDHSDDNLPLVNIDQPLFSSKNCVNSDKKLPIMKITHPAGCFSQFINFFGASIFVLWKLVLLRKRILFFSPPPIGVVCYRVYCACCLGKITTDGLNSDDVAAISPYFYVNVADIDVIAKEKTYIACTTEKVFGEKEQLFDVYVDNQTVTSRDPHLRDTIMKVNKCDQEKYANLINHKNDLKHQRGLVGRDSKEDDDFGALPSEESFYQSYFTQQNNEIFQTLLEVSCSSERLITNEHMRAMGLDPCSDRSFVMDLLELYAIDALLVADNPCCPY